MIPQRAHLITPLANLTKKGAAFEWTEECESNFQTIKQLLAKHIALSYPDFQKPFDVYTDASKYQLGAVISQDDKPIAFYSRKLTDTQTRYTVGELELLSIVETLREFRTIILGRQITLVPSTTKFWLELPVVEIYCSTKMSLSNALEDPKSSSCYRDENR
jgi:hypothetical protein